MLSNPTKGKEDGKEGERRKGENSVKSSRDCRLGIVSGRVSSFVLLYS